jgi:hypothetical protein
MLRSRGGSGTRFMQVMKWWGRLARRHVRNAEWEEKCSTQQWQSMGVLW